MKTAKTILITSLSCLMLFWIGCEQGQPVAKEVKEAKMEITPAWSGDYKVTIINQRAVEFEGPLKGDKDFQGGVTGTEMEMVYNQQIQEINEAGNAVARITIKELKYASKVKNDVRLDFDSAADTDSPLAKLIGQGYTIEIAPDGKIAKVADTAEALKVVQGTKSENKLAARFLSVDSIKEKHQLPLPASQLIINNGAQWGNIKIEDMGMIGKKSYECIYTVENIENADSQKVANITMKAIPSAQGQKQQADLGAFSKMFDNKESYDGQVLYNITKGCIKKWDESLKAEWVVVDPSATPDDKEPSAVRMKSDQVFKLEKLD
ncbi:MAG: hypothetical protein PHF37_06605 [Phycisphaerae bacterium]|nr:hypothetical protein [Phycisphaerae bacterium]